MYTVTTVLILKEIREFVFQPILVIVAKEHRFRLLQIPGSNMEVVSWNVIVL